MRPLEFHSYGGRPVVRLVPYPLPSAILGIEGGTRLALESAADGFPFTIIMARDTASVLTVEGEVARFMTSHLSVYARDPMALTTGWVPEYTRVAQEWLADLQWRAQAEYREAVGERALPRDFLTLLRSNSGHTRAMRTEIPVRSVATSRGRLTS